MAKPKASKAAAPDITAKIVVDATPDTPTYYCNHAEIAVNQHEVAICFARLPTKPGRIEIQEVQETGELVVEPEFQILIPPTLLDGLMNALQVSKERYEELFGPIRSKTDGSS